jgi:hypothetical protein
MLAKLLLIHALALRTLGTGVGSVQRPVDPNEIRMPVLIETETDCRPGAVCVSSIEQPGQDGWQAQMVAHFSRRSVKGTIIVTVYDMEDPGAVSRHEVTALWSVDAVSLKELALLVPLDREAGFRSGHTYRVRVVQLLRHREVVLAQGDVHLE